MTAFDGARADDDPGYPFAKTLAEHDAEYDKLIAAERAREVAAGYAAYDRMAIDGGPLVEASRRRRRWPLVVLKCLLALAVVALLAGAWIGIPGL